MVVLNIFNDFGIRTSDVTLESVTKRIESARGPTDSAKRRAVRAMTRLYKNDPVYFETYVRLFGKPPKRTITTNKNEINRAKRVLGLEDKEVTQNNVNLAYTRKSDENLPKRKSPKTQRALYDAYATLTRNGSALVR